MIDATGKMPAPRKMEAAIDPPHRTRRRIRRRRSHIRIFLPEIALRLLGEQRDLPGVDADDAGHPTGRAAGRSDQRHPLIESRQVQLQPAPLRRLHCAEHAGIRQRFHHVIRHAAGTFGFAGPGADLGQQRRDPGQKCIRLNCVGYGGSTTATSGMGRTLLCQASLIEHTRSQPCPPCHHVPPPRVPLPPRTAETSPPRTGCAFRWRSSGRCRSVPACARHVVCLEATSDTA